MAQQLDFKNYELKELHKILYEGQFAVPRLQRVFVWNGLKAAKLLDSVYRSMPIGALTVWDAPKANHLLLRADSAVLPRFNEDKNRIWFLLDGQQRLSVLYRMLEGGVVENGSHKKIDFSLLVFRVTEGDQESRFQYRKPIPKMWIPVADVLAANWRQRISGLTKGQENRLKLCRDRLLKYKVPIVKVEMNTIEDARELFLRINSSGTPLGAADRAFARASKFALRELAIDAWKKLPLEFQGLTDEVLLQTRALLDGVNEVGVEAMTQVVKLWDDKISGDMKAKVAFTRKWDAQQAAMHRALYFLRKEFRVLDDGLLPYKNMAATLTVFFYGHPKQPKDHQLNEIRKWFWGTALGQRYSGSGYRQHILDDVDLFNKLASGLKVHFKLDDRIDPGDIRKATYGKRSSISDAFYCLLAKHGPVHFRNGTKMEVAEYASQANRKHKHHIFPRKLLQKLGVSKVALNSVLNISFVSGEENILFADRAPIKYLEEYRGERHFARTMNQHLIPHDRDSGLWRANKRGYSSFLKEREKLICSAFNAAAKFNLFRRDDA